MAANKQMDLGQFEQIASECTRWSERSLSVVRALLVDNKPPSEVAATFDMLPQQAIVLKTRFLNKAEKVRVAKFMEKVAPKNSVLENYSADVRTLQKEGYMIDQIKRYLEKQGVAVSLTRLRKFIKSLGGGK